CVNSYCVDCFFFQAEDGIRDRNVTGVQTCALPISKKALIHGTMSACYEVGKALRLAVEAGLDPADTIAEKVGGWVICKGTVTGKIGRASCREREWRSGGAVKTTGERWHRGRRAGRE